MLCCVGLPTPTFQSAQKKSPLAFIAPRKKIRLAYKPPQKIAPKKIAPPIKIARQKKSRRTKILFPLDIYFYWTIMYLNQLDKGALEMAWGPDKTFIINVRCTCQEEYDILRYIHRIYRKLKHEKRLGNGKRVDCA